MASGALLALVLTVYAGHAVPLAHHLQGRIRHHSRCLPLLALRGGGGEHESAGLPVGVLPPRDNGYVPGPLGLPSAPQSRISASAHGRGLPRVQATEATGSGARLGSCERDGHRRVRGPPSALDAIRARLMQLPSEDEDGSVSLNSDEDRSKDSSRAPEFSRILQAERLATMQDKRAPRLGSSRYGSTRDTGLGMLTADQQLALDAVKRGQNVFLTGSAGTGKSYVLRHLIAALKRRHGNRAVHVTASTGAAAVLIGGTTVHAFAGIGLGKDDAATLVKKIYANKLVSGRWQRARALIIDEISMIDCDLFDKLDYVARQLKQAGRPFGGLQLIVCGDFFQLPPVSAGSMAGSKRFAFESQAWKEAVHETVELKRVMRQGEEKFVRVLNELRWGKVSAASTAALMQCQHKGALSPQWADGVELTKLYPYNVNVRAENEKRLQSLPGALETFTAEDSLKTRAGISSRLEALGVEKKLQLKIGAQVMCLKNLDVAAGLVNGARGVVTAMVSNATSGGGKLWPEVKFACGVTQVMTPETWSVLEADSVVAERKQVPLSLAWAVSVHKCQGMTLDRVEASLSQAFDHGMVYVALSRVKSLDGLRLQGFSPAKATAHPAVVSFYRSLGCVPPMEEAETLACFGRNQSSVSSSRLAPAAAEPDLSFLKADPRAFDAASEEAAPKVEDGIEGASGKTGTGQKKEEQSLQEVPLQQLLDRARSDPRLGESYAMAVRGAAFEVDATAPAASGDVSNQQAQSSLGRQVHEAVLSAAAQAQAQQAAQEQVYQRHRHKVFGPDADKDVSSDAAKMPGVMRARQRVRQRDGPHGKERGTEAITPDKRQRSKINQHISNWRQRFLRAAGPLPAMTSRSACAGQSTIDGNMDRSKLVAMSASPTVLASPAGAPSAVSRHRGERLKTEDMDGAREGSGMDGFAEHAVTGSASDSLAGESRSALQGVMGSSLHHRRLASSLASAPYPLTSPAAPVAAASRDSRHKNKSTPQMGVPSDAPASSNAEAGGCTGSGAWSVREDALSRAASRRKRLQRNHLSSSRPRGSLSYAPKSEFAPASVMFNGKTPKLQYKDRVRAHTQSIFDRLRAADRDM